MNWGMVNGWVIETSYDGYGYWIGRAIKCGQEILITRRREDKARDVIIGIVKGR